MKGWLIVAGLAGALLALISSLRGSAQEIGSALDELDRLTCLRSTPPPPCAQEIPSTAAQESFEEVEPVTSTVSSIDSESAVHHQEIDTYSDARRAADLLEEDLLDCFPFTGAAAIAGLGDSQRALLERWMAWSRDAVRQLPEELRSRSAYRDAIHAHFKSGLRSFLSDTDAESIDSIGEVSQGLHFSTVALTRVGETHQTASVAYSLLKQAASRE